MTIPALPSEEQEEQPQPPEGGVGLFNVRELAQRMGHMVAAAAQGPLPPPAWGTWSSPPPSPPPCFVGTPSRIVGLVSELAAARRAGQPDPASTLDPFLYQKALLTINATASQGWSQERAWQLANFIGDNLAAEYPDIWQIAADDLATAARLTDEDIWRRVLAGEVNPRSLTDDLLQASEEELSAWAGSSLAAITLTEERAILDGEWKAWDQTAQVVGLQLQYGQPVGLSPPSLGIQSSLGNTLRDYQASGSPFGSAQRMGTLPVPGLTLEANLPVGDPLTAWRRIAGRSGTWTLTDQEHIIYRVELQRPKEPRSEPANIVVKLDPGTKVVGGADAMIWLAQALAGQAHQIVGFDDIPGLQTMWGRIAQGIGGAKRLYEKSPISAIGNGIYGSIIAVLNDFILPAWGEDGAGRFSYDPDYQTMWSSTWDIAEMRARAQAPIMAQEVAAQTITPEEALIAAISARAAVDPDWQGDETVLALAADWSALSPADRDSFTAEVRGLAEGEWEPYYYDLLRSQSPVSDVVMNVGEWMLERFTDYDKLIHGLAIRLFQLPVAMKEAVLGRPTGQRGDRIYGWDAFYDSVSDIDATYLSEHWGLDGADAYWVDLSTSLFFDPLTWVTPGAAGLWKWSAAVAADPKLAATALRNFPALRKAARSALVHNNPMATIFFTRGMSANGIRRMAELAADPLVGWNRAGVRAVTDVFTQEMLHGGYIPWSATRAGPTRTVLGITDFFKNWDGWSTPERRRMTQLLMNLSQHRIISTHSEDWLDEVVDLIASRYPRDSKAFMESLTGALDAYDKATLLSGNMTRAAYEKFLADQLKALRAQRRAANRVLPPELGVELGMVPGKPKKATPRYRIYRQNLEQAENVAADLQAELEHYQLKGPTPPPALKPPGKKGKVPKAEIEFEARRMQGRVRITTDAEAQAASQALIDLEGMVRHLRRMVDDFGPTWQDYKAQRKGITTQINAVRRAQMHLDDPARGQLLIDWTTEFMDDWAAAILRRKGYTDDQIWTTAPNRLHSNPARKRLNYRLILDPDNRRIRKKGRWVSDTDDYSFWAPLYTRVDPATGKTVIDEQMRAALEGSGFYLQFGSMPLGASPWDLVAFDAAADSQKWRDIIYSAPARGWGNAFERLRSLFSMNMLLNPMTAIRAGLDEPLRFLAETGDWKDFLKMVGVSIPGVGRATRPFRNPHVAAYARDNNNVFLGRHVTWGMSTPSTPKHAEHVERWLNGQGREIEGLRVWAQAVRKGDSRIFRDWYERDWSRRARDTSKLVISPVARGRKKLTWNDIYYTIDNAIDEWLKSSPSLTPAEQATWKRHIVNSWADNKRLDELFAGREASNALWRFYRQAGNVPAEQFVGSSFLGAKADVGPNWFGRMVDATWGTLYGEPQRIRSGFMDEYYYDWAKSVYDQRFQGRLIDTAWIRGAVPGITEEEALALMATPSPALRQAAYNAGMMWPARLEQMAQRFAARHADDLMYQFVTSSLLGKRVQRYLSPYARAGTDFVRWWGKKLFEPFTFGLSPNARRAMYLVGGEAMHPIRTRQLEGLRMATGQPRRNLARRVLEAGEVTEPMTFRGGRVYMPTIAGQPIPFNLRLWSRFGHQFAAAERERDMEEQRARELGLDPAIARAEAGRNMIGNMWGGPTSPLGALKAFTFFPDDLRGDDILYDIMPQPGYLPAAVILLISDALDMNPDHPVRAALDDLFPSLRFYDNTHVTEDPQTWMALLMPSGGRALSGLLGSAYRLLMQNSAGDPRIGRDDWRNYTMDFTQTGTAPPGVASKAADAWGDFLNSSVWDVDPDSAEWQQTAEGIWTTALGDANAAFALSRIGRPISPFQNSRLPAESGYIGHYQPIVEDLPKLRRMGLVTSEQIELIRRLWRRFEKHGQPGNQNLTDKEINALAGALSDIYYSTDFTVTMPSEMATAFDQALRGGRTIPEALVAAGLSGDLVRYYTPEALATIAATHSFVIGLPQEMKEEWLIRWPGLAVNAVSKLRARVDGWGNPAVPDRYASYFYPDGRLDMNTLNQLGYEEASQVRAIMLAETTLTDRPAWKSDAGEGWMENAQRLVWAAGRNDLARIFGRIAIHYDEKAHAWLPEPYQSRQSDSMLAQTYRADQVAPADRERLTLYGITLPDTFTGQWLRDTIGVRRDSLLVTGPTLSYYDLANRRLAANNTPPPSLPGETAAPTGVQLYQTLNGVARGMAEMGYENLWDYPEKVKEALRMVVYGAAIELGYITTEDYRRSGLNRILGELDMTPPQITDASQLSHTIVATGDEIKARLSVVDGDTIWVLLDHTILPVRLQGINAPDQGQEGYEEATKNLEALLYDNAHEVTLGFFEPERYGVYQIADPTTGKMRVKMFLIVDGVPIIDPALYTTATPQGVRTGVPWYVPPILDIYQAGRTEAASAAAEASFTYNPLMPTQPVALPTTVPPLPGSPT